MEVFVQFHHQTPNPKFVQRWFLHNLFKFREAHNSCFVWEDLFTMDPVRCWNFRGFRNSSPNLKMVYGIGASGISCMGD